MSEVKKNTVEAKGERKRQHKSNIRSIREVM